MELTVIEFEPIVKQSGLGKAEQYAAIFAPFMITLKELSNKAETINKDTPSVLDAKIAREVRLAMAKNRTASEKIKDANKASLIAESNLIQNLYNIISNASKLSETDLDAVEKYAENKEKERKAALAVERAAMFADLETDLTGYDLGGMSDNVFSDLLESQKLLYAKKLADAAKVEAERIAGAKAEIERQAALKAENERLKTEAIEAARLAKIESDKADILAKENAAKLAAIEAENNRVRQKAAADLKDAQDAADKANEIIKAKKEAERKEATYKLAAENKAAKAPIKQKIELAITSLKLELPVSEITIDILAKFNGFKSWALQQIETL